MKLVSIVVPAYDEETCIPSLIEKIEETFSSLPYKYELIIVDDGSTDNSFELLKSYSTERPFLKGIRLSRNMGHQAALDCGLKNASGDAIICMDADHQHPPSLIPEMLMLWENNYDIVSTQKIETNEYGQTYKWLAKIFYSFFNKYSKIKIIPNASDFRLMSRKSLNAVLSMPEYHRFYRGLVPFVGFKTATLTFAVDKRFAGKRKYTFKKSLELATDGLFSFSDFALKIPIYIGSILLIIILLYLIVALLLFITGKVEFVHGWTSIIVILIFSISIQLIFIGVIGVYIGKIFVEVKRRPVFFIDEVVGDLNNLNK